MSNVKFICHYCGRESEKYIGHVNRALKQGNNIYCSRICGGLGRRTSLEEKKAVKAAYDKKIYNTPERIAARKKYFQKSYKQNPEKYKAIRAAKYPKHLEYLNTPKYKEYKKEYDKKRRAAILYGEFSEAALIFIQLDAELQSQQIKYDLGIINKTQKRKRQWKNLQRQT